MIAWSSSNCKHLTFSTGANTYVTVSDLKSDKNKIPPSFQNK